MGKGQHLTASGRRFSSIITKMAPRHLISILLVSMVTVMPISSQQCPVIQGYTPIVTKPGADLTLGLMLSLHKASQDTTGGALCNFNAETGYGSLSMKAAVAATDNWPDSIQLPGLSVGLEIYDMCDTFQLAEFSAVRFANERYNDIFANGMLCANKTLHMGVVGYGFSSWSETLSTLLQPLDIPLIAYTATSDSLSDAQEYPNFFRTVAPDSGAVKALVAIMKSYNWTYSAIVHSDDSYGMSGLKAATESIREAGFCLTEPISVGIGETRDSVYDAIVDQLIQRNITVVILWVVPANLQRLFLAVERIQGAAYDISWLSGDVPLYNDFTSNPGIAKAARGLFALSPFVDVNDTYKSWFAQWYPNTDFNHPPVVNMIYAIHAYMSAFSLAHQEKCGSQQGMCEALANIQGSEFIDFIRQVNFTGIGGRAISFNENDDPANQFYDVMQFKSTGTPNAYSLQKVGEWTTDQGLTLNKDQVEFYGQGDTPVGPPTSVCMEGSCFDPSCQELTDFVIETLFSHHVAGCQSQLKLTRFKQLEAVFYAVHLINKDPNLLPDVRLSLMVNDICYSDTFAANNVGLTLVKNWDFDVGFPTQNNKYHLLGTLHSSSSSRAKGISKDLQVASIPVIDNTASSPALSDKEEFGNFLRTVSSDVKQAEAIVDLLGNLDFKYVQTINSKGAYGDDAIKAVKESAKNAGVCIANSFRVDINSDFAELVRELMAKPEAKTVVVFLFTSHARRLFQELVFMNVSAGQFQFIGSDNWGTRMDYIPGLENPAKGALTVTFKSERVPEFEEYFLDQTPNDTAYNPFFKEYWMQKFECDLPGEQPKYNQNCTGSEMLSSSDVNSLEMEYFINSVYVYAIALSNLINDTCPNGKVCDAVFDIAREEWLERLKAVDFVSQVGLMRRVSFDENGDGPARYSVYQFIEMNSVYRYDQIGSWDDVDGLSNLVDNIIDPMFLSVCTGLCLECNPPTPPDANTTSHQDYFRIPGDLDFPVVMQLSKSGDGVKCGDPKPEESLALESLLYALDKVNADPSVLPGVKLGVTVVDSCGNPAIATRKLVGLLGGFVSLESSGKPFAVLGPANPDVAEEISNIVTAPSKLPMISYSALSPNVNDDPLVLATSAPYTKEVAAIIGILEEFDWKYVGVVHSMTPYGIANSQEFQTAAQVAGICLGAQHYLNDTTDFQEIMNDFSSDDSLNVIVAFVNEEDARSLLYADHFKLSKRFVWVGTDSWDSPNLVSGLESSAKGMLLVTKERPDLPEIQDYFADSDLLDAASARNPYLRDYLQDICPSSSNCQFGNQIQESLQKLSGEISPLVNALYVAAHGANLLHDSKCGFSNDELCESFLDSSPEERADAIRRVTVESGAGGNPFSFDERSGPATYSIKNYQYDGQHGQFLIVGKWQNNDLALQIVAELAAQRGPSGCSCGPIVVAEGGDPVQVYMYVWKWIDYGIWSTVILAVSGLCGVLALLIGILFLSKRHSYVVQSASFSLSMWLLFGIILMYLLNVAFMFEANPAICGIRRFGVSFVYCVVYAALLVKSIRANRFARKQPGVDLNFAGSWSQSLLFLAFLLPEAFLVVEWLVLIPPDAIGGPLDACGTVSLPTCGITNIDLTIFMMYAYLLVLVTFLSSFGALDSSHAHHEGKSILVSSLFSILILITWACVLNLLDPEFGIPAIPIGLTADATIILVFMFMGKVDALTKKKEDMDTGLKRVKDVEMEDNLYGKDDVKKVLAMEVEDTVYENDSGKKYQDVEVEYPVFANAGATLVDEAVDEEADGDVFVEEEHTQF
ncbi:uncharacterized protein LOC119730773 [Patiria miniata]|uniref:G-protein coupled receptors family 3 profile domain-containing protein n=1 Tax=Patiria miniata TaxID=46514 RepID=A0A914A8J3_PATMI|nr:uncharacterized protein LOC119730773 [Patiria miniata]